MWPFNKRIPSKFTPETLEGPVKIVVRISQIADTIRQIYLLYDSCFDFEAGDVTDMISCSIVGVCPKCGGAAMGDQLLKFQLFSTMFQGRSSGGSSALERMASGRCANPHCSGSDMEIISRPDLDAELERYVSGKGTDMPAMRQALAIIVRNKKGNT